jgi:hypothetical protein
VRDAQQAVGGLHVAVHHALRVQVRQAGQQRGGVRRGLGLGERAAGGDAVRERRARAAQLKQQIHVRVVLEGALEAHQAAARGVAGAGAGGAGRGQGG